jgi:5'-nucleotidase (lipoprotein e(P4) family)
MSKSAIVFLSIVMSLVMMGQPENDATNHRTLDAILWVQCSAEWRAHCQQAFNLASRELSSRLEDSTWTAALEQSADDSREEKKPAIIVDIDETVLDNSPYQARLVLDGKTYTDESWKAWVNQCEASPVPGALPFLIEASRKGVEIFYVTNRKVELEESTRKNLAKFGFPLNAKLDTVLTKNEQPDWTSDKTSRRRLIAKTHRVLMLIGDDFGDFSGAARVDFRTRKEAGEAYGHLWGCGWFILPNPTYGSWQKSVVGFRRGLSPKAKSAFELNSLDPRRQ